MPRRNPPLMTDLVEFIGPGFASFAVTRFATRLAAQQLGARKPSWGKHAGAVVSAGAFLSAWFLAHRWKWLERWHTPIVVGSAIAAIQSIVQLYIPRIGWMLDAVPEEIASPQQAAAGQLAAPQLAELGLRAVDEDPNEYTYNDEYDPGLYAKPQQPPGVQADVSDLAMDDAVGQSGNLGVFQN